MYGLLATTKSNLKYKKDSLNQMKINLYPGWQIGLM